MPSCFYVLATFGPRKGVPAHKEIIAAYTRGIEWQDGDVVVFADCLPNRCGFQQNIPGIVFCSLCSIGASFFFTGRRYAEFGHAVMDRLFDSTVHRPPIYYIGVMREDQRDCQQTFERILYDHWDTSEAAPPKRRQVEALPVPTLELLSWSGSAPIFPDAVLQKFAEGSTAHAEVLGMRKELHTLFPDSVSGETRTQQGSRPTTARATGRPDFAIEGGAKPLDVTRIIEKAHTPQSSFEVERLVVCKTIL